MKSRNKILIRIFSSLIFLMLIFIMIYKYATGPILSNDFSQVKNIKYRIISANEWKNYLHIKMFIKGITKDNENQIYEVLNDRQILGSSKYLSPSIYVIDSLIILKDSIYLEIYNKNVVNVDEVNPNICAKINFKSKSTCIKGNFSTNCYELVNLFELKD